MVGWVLVMAERRSWWARIMEALCCFVAKDASPDSSQQQLHNASENSDPESIFDQPVQTPLMSQIKILPRWEDREAMYQKRIHDLEKELTTVLKNRRALSAQLYGMGCLAFPEMDPCDSASPSFAEKLKVYLECLLLERQQLEKRVLWAEQTISEMENEVCYLEKRLHDFGYRTTHRMEHSFMPHGPLPLCPTQPIRSFLSKMYKKSPERKGAGRSPEKQDEESFGEVAPQKKSPVTEVLAKVTMRSTEGKSGVPRVKRDIFTERLSQTVSYPGAGSWWPVPRYARYPNFRASDGDTCVALVHRHWDAHPERELEDLAQGADVDSLSTASTLPVVTPSCGASQDIKMSPDSSLSWDINPALQRATVEGNCEIGRQGEVVTSKEEECVTSGSISLKPVGLAGRDFKNPSDDQTNPQKLDDLKTKTFQDPLGHAASRTEINLPGIDSLESGKSQNINIVHSSDQIADVEPGTGQALLAEQAFCGLGLLQKPGDLSSLELSLQAFLPSSSIKSPEPNYPLGEKRVLDDATGLNNKADQPICMEESPTVASPPQLKPGELLPSGLKEALTSFSSESPQPTSSTEESPSSLVEEAAV